MPRYDYRCNQCGNVIEFTHGFDEGLPDYVGCGTWTLEGHDVVRQCQGEFVKQFSATPAIFRGTGWASKDKR